MKRVILGIALGAACVSWAVTPHEDGSVTYTREELDAIRAQFYSLQSSVNYCSGVVHHLREENEALKKEIDRLNQGRA